MAKNKKRKIHPLLMTVAGVEAVSLLTYYGVDYLLDLHQNDAQKRIFASGIVQREKYSRDTKNEVIDFDKNYNFGYDLDIVNGEYTDGKYLAEQLSENDVRCCIIDGEFYTATGESILYYYRYVRDDLIKEGVVYHDERRRFTMPRGIDFSDCKIITSHYFEEIDENLICTKKEKSKTLTLS